MNIISPLTDELAGKALDALWKRTSAISDNISNNDTPGYHQKSVSFEDQLDQAISGGSLTESQIMALSPQVVKSPGTIDQDGNGVDMEAQMVELVRNQLQYNYVERALSDNYGLLKTAASEGRK